MASLLSSSLSLRFPRTTLYAKPPPLSRNPANRLITTQHPRRNPVTIKLKREETSFRPLCVGRSNGQGEPDQFSHFIPLSPLETIVDDFYASLNKKNLHRLRELIADDCVFEDLAFSKPFEGEEAHHFLKDLTEAMGKDVKFIIDRVCEARELSVAASWHLEWQNKRIPFATGCAFFDCALKGEHPLIKRATVYFESPLKPGVWALKLLKIISSLFDKFPKQAKWFLEKPQALIQFMIKAYKTLIEPFIIPLLVYYTNLWTYGACILRYLLNLVERLLRMLLW